MITQKEFEKFISVLTNDPTAKTKQTLTELGIQPRDFYPFINQNEEALRRYEKTVNFQRQMKQLDYEEQVDQSMSDILQLKEDVPSAVISTYGKLLERKLDIIHTSVKRKSEIVDRIAAERAEQGDEIKEISVKFVE